MKNCLKVVSIAAVAFCIGLTTANYAVSDVPANYKVAVVDVQKIIEASSQVKSLKDEQKKKGEDLANFIKTAKTSIDKESDSKKKSALEEKYTKEFQSKRASIAKNYETKLLSIEKEISSVIDTQAKSGGYDLVLAKGVVLSGGTDITSEIAKQIK